MANFDTSILEAMKKAMAENKNFRDMLVSMVEDATKVSSKDKEGRIIAISFSL